MNILTGPRRTGKTTTLIKLCHTEGGVIVCANKAEALRIYDDADKISCHVPMPITYGVFIRGEYHGRGFKNLFIDNLDDLVQYIAKTNIHTATMTGATITGEII